MKKRLTEYVPNYVVFDFETTGKQVLKDEIIEIAGIKVHEGEIVDVFQTLVHPSRPIPYYATAKNGITNKLVIDAPIIKEALPKFLDFIGDEILVGHNIYAVDLQFLYHYAKELGREIQNDYVDTLPLSKICLPEMLYYTMRDVAEHFEIPVETEHRAMDDCVTNQLCFEKLGEIYRNGIPELRCPKCGGTLQKRNGRFGTFFGCSNFPDCMYTRSI